MESCCDISLVESANSDLSAFDAGEDDENQRVMWSLLKKVLSSPVEDGLPISNTN